MRPWLGGDGQLDFTRIVSDTANVCLKANFGGWIMHKQAEGIYEGHSMFLPEGRGGQCIEAMHETIRYMFAATDCVEIRTKIPDGNKGAKGLGIVAGFREQFRREKCWRALDGEMVGISFQTLPLERWRNSNAECLAKGEWFHVKLEEAKQKAGSPLPAHDDDEAHNRAVGASVLMVQAGNPRKAVWSYNRWASFAGYAPIVLLSDAPVMLDVMDAIVAPSGADMEILLCREGLLQA